MQNSQRRISITIRCLLIALTFALLNGTLVAQKRAQRRKLTNSKTAVEVKNTKHVASARGLKPAPVLVQRPVFAAASTSNNKPRLVVQTGFTSDLGVDSAAFSSDGHYVVTGSWGAGAAIIWDVHTGAELRRLIVAAPGGQDGYMAVAFSPDTRFVAVTGELDLYVFDIATGKIVRRLAMKDEENGSLPENLYFSPDGRRVTVGSFIWDLASRRIVGRVKTRSADTYTAVSPNGRFRVEIKRNGDNNAAAEKESNNLVVTDARTGRELKRLKGIESFMALAISPDGKTIVTCGSFDTPTRVWDVERDEPVRELKGFAEKAQTIFTPAGPITALSSLTDVHLLDWTTGRIITLPLKSDVPTDDAVVSPDGQLVSVSAGKEIIVLNTATEHEVSRIKRKDEKYQTEAMTFSPDGRFLTGMSRENYSSYYNVMTGKEVKAFKCFDCFNPDVTFSPDGKLPVRVDDTLEGATIVSPEIFSTEDGHIISRIRFKKYDYSDVIYFAFSPDGRMLVSGSGSSNSREGTTVRVWDVQTGRSLRELEGHQLWVQSVAWSPDGKLIATASADGTARLWNAATGTEIRRLQGHGASVREVQFSPDGRYALTTSEDEVARLCDVQTGRALARLVTLTGGDWVVIDEQGRFDTNNLESISGLHWIAPDDPLHALPLEIFMRDYYEPRLLARILAGEKFKSVRALANLNRVQPQVKITKIEPVEDKPELVNVTVEVAKGHGEHQRQVTATTWETGVYDLRLFRNGQLVGQTPTSDATGSVSDDDLHGWRERTRVRLGEHGHQTITFSNIRVPRLSGVKELVFSAYAFNEDRVKSATSRELFAVPAGLPVVKGRAYIISIGVNAYENDAWDLRFAANDARRMQDVVAQSLAQTGDYEEIVRVPLISDYELKDGNKTSPRILTETSATKSNFKTVLDLLSGKQIDPQLLKQIPGATQLRSATPEDLVIITFSSHGYADERGNFFLIPYDTGTGMGQSLRDILAHCISSDELSLWLRDVDAGSLVLVVDACHSAASVQGEGFKPGPMGSRGLGQLSYDKGMRILTSTQADDVALESKLIEQGLLTYVLTHDGIERWQADFKPLDKMVTVSEWLTYGVEHVPVLYKEVQKRIEEMRAGGLRSSTIGEDAQAKVIFTTESKAAHTGYTTQGTQEVKGLTLAIERRKAQQPALFDFAPKQRTTVLAKTQ